jgi:hypothetical protein
MEPRRRPPNMSKFIESLNAPLPPVSSTSEFDDLTFFASTDMFDFDAIDTAQSVDQSVNVPQSDAASSTMQPWNLQTGPDYVIRKFLHCVPSLFRHSQIP